MMSRIVVFVALVCMFSAAPMHAETVPIDRIALVPASPTATPKDIAKIFDLADVAPHLRIPREADHGLR